MSTTYLPFSNNAIQVYAYEGFNYTIVNSAGASLSNSSGLQPTSLYFSNDASGNTVFVVTDTASTLVASTRPETFVLTGATTSSNTVTINPGRFLDGTGQTLSNRSYTFYKNETIPPIRLVAPSFTLKQPTSIPSLPPGLSFVSNASNIYEISGTPLVPVPTSNYQIIGVQQGGSKVVTTRFNISVSNERLQMNLLGSSNISNMVIGTPITPRVLTAIPPVGSGTVRYSFPLLPDGIVVQDTSGNTYSNITTFTPTDPSYTMIITGTPTLAAAQSFRNAGVTSNYTIQGSRTIPLPILENSQSLTFSFAETILFDTPVISNNYTGIPIDPSLNYFAAKTYFTSNVPITNIFSPDLVSIDPSLSLVFSSGPSNYGYAYLTGTTSVAGTKSFTVRAVNANTNTRDYPATVIISNDSVNFTSPVGVDLCYNFILSRPVNQAKDGYYPSNIRFAASAASGRPITLSAPALTGTGLSLDSNGVISGIPSTVKPLGDLVVTASTGTTANTKTVKFAILNDVITLGSASFSFVQNIPITPVQIPVVSTLSGRNVIDFISPNLPSGLSLSSTGVVSGTCLISDTSGTINVTATTGYATGSTSYSFTNTPDTILFTVPQDLYSYLAGDSVLIPTTAVAYSGRNVSNFQLTLPSPYGLSVGSTSGLISGVWTDSVPPNQVLPSSGTFSVTAIAGGISGELPATFTASPTIQKTSFVWGSGKLYKYNDVSWSYVSDVSSASNSFDIQLKNTAVDGNFILFTSYNRIWKATNAVSFISNSVGNLDASGNDTGIYQIVSSLASKPGSTRWWVSGTQLIGGTQTPVVVRSDDNGVSWKTTRVLQETSTGLKLGARDSNAPLGNSNPYLNAGVALKYKTGVLLAGGMEVSGGPTMLRSTNDGDTWASVSCFAKETAYINVDGSGVWVASGSDRYKSINFAPDSTTTNTIKYSTDNGVTWSNTSGGFTRFGYEVVYGSNVWVASGVDVIPFVTSSVALGVKYSTDGSNWSNVDIFGGVNPYSNVSVSEIEQFRAPLPIGSIQYDGSNWNVFVQRQDASLNWVSRIYSAPSITSTWTYTDVTSSFPQISNDKNRRFINWSRPNFLRTSQSKQINIDLAFSTGIGNGPTFTSPLTSSFILYQYIPVSIPLSATGSGNIYFFATANELPPGLTFNPLTNTITGRPASIGNYVTTLYAKDASGITQLDVGFTVNVPRVVRKQDGAGAYTSLLRQYTEVLGAQNARDNRALPSQERALGEFMSPPAPDVTTAEFSTTKCKFCGKVTCPTVLETVETGDAELKVCDFIDANGTNLDIDLGNAELDECD